MVPLPYHRGMRTEARALLFLLSAAAPALAGEPGATTPDALPAHLTRWPGLYVRNGQQIVEAPAEDQATAKGYPGWPNKGALKDGMRLTLMTKKTRYAPGEEIRVLHVFEAPGPGIEVYVMGPKFIHGESVNGAPVSGPPESSTYPWLGVYDGAVLKSPAVDYNYDITSYRFSEPGTYVIGWQLGALRANSLTLQIGDNASPATNVAPLFQYAEDSDTVSFFSPRSVRIARAQSGTLKVCQYVLSDHGNMWTGPEVEKAFRAAEVQSALLPQSAPYSAESAGKLTVGASSIVWAATCKKCREQTAALKQLRGVLSTVMLNARLMCK